MVFSLRSLSLGCSTYYKQANIRVSPSLLYKVVHSIVVISKHTTQINFMTERTITQESLSFIDYVLHSLEFDSIDRRSS